MVDAPPVVEQSRPIESLPKNAKIVTQLETRISKGKPPDIVALDVDGTTYEKVKENESWKKVGDNTESSSQMKQKDVPHIFVSGRPDWDHQSDAEMRALGFQTDALVVATGAGSIVKWRDEQGNLVIDREYEERMKNQAISYEEGDKKIEATYNPTVIQSVLEGKLDQFHGDGLGAIRVEANSSIGFTVLDLNDMPFDKLQALAKTIRQTVTGVKVEFSEDLEHVAAGKFTGWMQIVPLAGGKDGSLRYIGEKLAEKINPMSADPAKKPHIHAVGDAAIDIWMLAMGVSNKDPYAVDQYLLANKTPYAAEKIDRVAGVLNQARELTDAERAKVAAVKERMTQHYTPLMRDLQLSNDTVARDTLREQLQEEIDPHRALLRIAELETMKARDSRMAHIHQLAGTGANGILEVVNQLQ